MSLATSHKKARSLRARFSLSVISGQILLGSVASFLPAAVPSAFAAVTVETATGGDAIDNSTVGGAYTSLTKPKIKEGVAGDIGVGTIILNVPSGFEFDTGGTAPTVRLSSASATASCNINNTANNTDMAITSITTTQITFTITDVSTVCPGANANDLTWQNVRVRPTVVSPLASGDLTVSGTSTINGVSGSTNFGTLTEIGRTVTKAVSSYSGAADSDVTYTITITNDNSADASSVTVTDVLPANTTFVSGSRTGGTEAGGQTVSCAEAAGTVTCTVGGDGKVHKKKSIIITLVLHVTSSAPCGTISNTARYLSSNGIDITSSAADISVSSACSSTATLTVTATVVNDNGGTKVVGDFPLFIDATGVTSGVANAGITTGAHTVSVTGTSGYDVTIGGDCAGDGTITLAAADNKSCSVTLDDIAPTLTVTKVVVNDNGGTKIVSDFPLFIDATGVTSGVANTVTAGVTYTVSETTDPEYAQDVIAGDCASDGTITLAVGENKTCIITNDDKPATLHIIKEVTNDNGGTKVESDFTINVSGNNPSSSSFAGAAFPGTDITIDAGSYDITETADAGYAATYSTDCSGTLLPGDDKTCTVSNDDIQPIFTVNSNIINDNGGTLTDADFPAFFDGSPVTYGSSFGIDAGSYVVSEIAQPSIYAYSFSGDCDAFGNVTLQVGDVKQCTITNDDIAPTLTIIKQVDNSNGDNKTPDDFTLTIDGVTVTNGVPTSLNVGAHTAGEVEDTDYHATITGDCGASNGTVFLNLGENRTCTLTNHDRPRNSNVVNQPSPIGSANSQTNGGAGSQTNLLGNIANFVAGGNGGGLPPGSFGGGPDTPWSPQEKEFLCSMQKKAPVNNPGLFAWFAGYVASLIGRDADQVSTALQDATLCVTAPEAKVETAPTAIRLDKKGRVVSNNALWNACVRGDRIPLGLIQHNPDKIVDRNYSRPKTCRDYNMGSDRSVWKMPGEFGIEVTVDAKGRLIGDLPTGYVAVKDKTISNVAAK